MYRIHEQVDDDLFEFLLIDTNTSRCLQLQLNFKAKFILIVANQFQCLMYKLIDINLSHIAVIIFRMGIMQEVIDYVLDTVYLFNNQINFVLYRFNF